MKKNSTEKSRLNIGNGKQQKSKSPLALVLCGYGINCEEETAHCLSVAGAQASIVHVNTLIANKDLLRQAHIFVIPGGFSYGDHIASGKILANKLRFTLADELEEFNASGKAILGICNGFQVLLKSGLLPGKDFQSSTDRHSELGNENQLKVSLIANLSARYEDRWVDLQVAPATNSFWLQGIQSLSLPVRHGEGRLVFADRWAKEAAAERHLCALGYASADGGLTQQYPANPNGSELACAGLVNSAGNVFGLMPHPEAFSWKMHAPNYFSDRLREKSYGPHNAVAKTKTKRMSKQFLQLNNEGARLEKMMKPDDGAGMVFFYNVVHAMQRLPK